MKKYLEDFLGLCYARLDKGEKEHRDDYLSVDLYQQIIEELADVFNYAFLEYVRLRNLQLLKKKLDKM